MEGSRFLTFQIKLWRKRNGESNQLIAVVNGEPFGIAMFAIDLGNVYGLLEKGYGIIMGFYIRPNFRRKGLGTIFNRHIETVLYEDGATNMYICPDAVTGEPFWKANGYNNSGKIDPDDKKPIYIKKISAYLPESSISLSSLRLD